MKWVVSISADLVRLRPFHAELRASASATLGKRDLVQNRVELRPNLVSLGGADMAKRAFRFIFDLGGRSLRLVMIEIEVPPATGVGKPLRVLDSRVRPVEHAREITPTRRLRSRAIRVFTRPLGEQQLLEKKSSVGEYARLPINIVRPRLDVDVVVLREVCLAAIQRVGVNGVPTKIQLRHIEFSGNFNSPAGVYSGK